MQETINVVKDRITNNTYNYLQKDFSDDEVFEAINQMKSNAAPGPDGMPALFYQSYWEVIGNDSTNYVLNILNHNGDPESYSPMSYS